MWKNICVEVALAVAAIGTIALFHALVRLIMQGDNASDSVRIILHILLVGLLATGVFLVSTVITEAMLLLTNKSQVDNAPWPEDFVLFLAMMAILSSFFIESWIEKNVDLLTQALAAPIYIVFGMAFYFVVDNTN